MPEGRRQREPAPFLPHARPPGRSGRAGTGPTQWGRWQLPVTRREAGRGRNLGVCAPGSRPPSPSTRAPRAAGRPETLSPAWATPGLGDAFPTSACLPRSENQTLQTPSHNFPQDPATLRSLGNKGCPPVCGLRRPEPLRPEVEKDGVGSPGRARPPPRPPPGQTALPSVPGPGWVSTRPPSALLPPLPATPAPGLAFVTGPVGR